jgi:hypothetical protein
MPSEELLHKVSYAMGLHGLVCKDVVEVACGVEIMVEHEHIPCEDAIPEIMTAHKEIKFRDGLAFEVVQ